MSKFWLKIVGLYLQNIEFCEQYLSNLFDTHWFYRSLIHFIFPFAIIYLDVPFAIYGTVKSVSTNYLEVVNIENWSGS